MKKLLLFLCSVMMSWALMGAELKKSLGSSGSSGSEYLSESHGSTESLPAAAAGVSGTREATIDALLPVTPQYSVLEEPERAMLNKMRDELFAIFETADALEEAIKRRYEPEKPADIGAPSTLAQSRSANPLMTRAGILERRINLLLQRFFELFEAMLFQHSTLKKQVAEGLVAKTKICDDIKAKKSFYDQSIDGFKSLVFDLNQMPTTLESFKGNIFSEESKGLIDQFGTLFVLLVKKSEDVLRLIEQFERQWYDTCIAQEAAVTGKDPLYVEFLHKLDAILIPISQEIVMIQPLVKKEYYRDLNTIRGELLSILDGTLRGSIIKPTPEICKQIKDNKSVFDKYDKDLRLLLVRLDYIKKDIISNKLMSKYEYFRALLLKTIDSFKGMIGRAITITSKHKVLLIMPCKDKHFWPGAV